MTRRRTTAGVGVVVLLSGISAAMADPVTFVWRGNMRGSLNGVDFPMSPFRVEAVGDTDDLENSEAGPTIWHREMSTLEITGVASLEFDFSTYIWTWSLWNGAEYVGMVGLAHAGFTILNGPVTTGLYGWDMQSSIGPVSGFGSWNDNALDTSAGTLIPETTAAPIQFQAIVVPEPATASLLVFGALAAAGALRRRR